jgi:hypothetical protein
MKRVVTGGDLSQRDMRPPALVETYVSLVEADIRRLGLLEAPMVERSCPACGAAGEAAFERLGHAYRSCKRCASLFVSPVPSPERLARYHAESQAERFWRETMLAATAAVRSRHALGPRIHWAAAAAAARMGSGLKVCDVGGRDPHLRELLLAIPTFAEYIPAAGEPTAGDHKADVVVAFDTLERSLDLQADLRRCRRLLGVGGLLFVSTLSGNGFEVRLLRGRMRALIPPVHLQLLSKAGWTISLESASFRLAEYSTPGELDVQAVAEACRSDPTLALPPIIDELVRQDDETVSRSFQEVLQQAGLSAHVQFEAIAVETQDMES